MRRHFLLGRRNVRHELSESERATYRRFARMALPRHTSYPIAPVWRETYGPSEFEADLRGAAGQPLSIYVHVPFCERLCYYCACTKEIIPPQKRAVNDPGEPLIAGLAQEASRLSAALEGGDVRQVHLGGGSPTFLRADQLERLWDILASRFTIAPDAEIAVEIDPRITTREQLDTLRRLGFGRVSLGIQDFSPIVQRAVNRLQPFETVERAVSWCRELGFDSVNFDLIYGLPYQTIESMTDTVDKTVLLSPDRIAFYRLAVIPEMFRWQNVFRAEDLPGGDLPLELNLLAIGRFQAAGYEFIGLDHFARPTEALAQARRERTLHRNFQGMTTGKQLELVGLGPSAISQLDSAFSQNQKTSAHWQDAVARGLPVERGLRLSDDDRLRRELMQQLYGHGEIDKSAIEDEFRIPFDDAFADELSRLRELADEGLIELGAKTIRLTDPLGRLLVRVVAAVFDAYLPRDAYKEGLPAHLSSKVG